MTDVRFYHLQSQPLDQALPSILTKALEKGHRIVVRLPDSSAVERLNEHLWTWRPDSFLPHGSRKDGYAEDQPVYLTDKDENPNGADVLVLARGAQSAQVGDYKLCCEMLEGHDTDGVESARARWGQYKEAGHAVTYWQQTANGGWEQKS